MPFLPESGVPPSCNLYGGNIQPLGLPCLWPAPFHSPGDPQPFTYPSHFSHHFPCSSSSPSKPNAFVLWSLLKANNVSLFWTLISLLPTVVAACYIFWHSQAEGEMRVNFLFLVNISFPTIFLFNQWGQRALWLFWLGSIPQFNSSTGQFCSFNLPIRFFFWESSGKICGSQIWVVSKLASK